MTSTSDFASRQAQARQLVQDIARSHGYIREETLSSMPADHRREVEEAMFRKDEMIGAGVITLAKNLYSKDVRFIFELLQNADDNHFSRATSLSAEPYVSFHVHSDRIIVDCNEDGFNEANIRAICDVGKSSKTGAQGYIGEKGIGFKSVFKVAWKVEIQSGAYSFSFTHRKGNSGFGMISPVWFWPAQELPGPLTRITLFLHDNTTGGESTQRQNILDQFKELQPAMLLFLKKLKRIEVKVYSEHGDEVTSSTSLSIRQSEINRRVLEKVLAENDNTESTKQNYHIVQSTARNLSRNENREYSKHEEVSRAYSTAPVVLAFPLSDSNEPDLEPQDIFAFLPVRKVGFNFLIHSDFVTSANREDIVTTSSRNIALLDTLADSFVVGMRELCQYSTLKYQWMRYLPKLASDHWDPFWKRLVDKIKDRISNEEILVLRNSPTLARMPQARRLDPIFHDHQNKPLLYDFPSSTTCYISPNYQEKDLSILQAYGLHWLYYNEFISLVRIDLSLPMMESRLRRTTDNDWQKHASQCLNLPFLRGWADQIRQMKELELVPLTSGKWVNTINSVVFFSVTSSGLEIPSDLGYQLVDPRATQLPDRKKLFTNLGVAYLPDLDVRLAILRKYASYVVHSINLEISLSHLRFLYLTRTLGPPSSTYPGLCLCDRDERLYYLHGSTFYFQDTAAYGLWSLMSKVGERPNWPDIHFLHEKYENVVGNVGREEWKIWLVSLGVCEYPRLVDNALFQDISEECRFVAKHLPSELLGFLRYSWNGAKPTMYGKSLSKLKALEVPCQGGRMEALSETYLPLPALLAKRDEFMRYGETFPFVDIGETLNQTSQWDFLADLGVKSNSDIDFYLKLLDNIAENPTDPSRICHLYLQIQSECRNSNADVQKQNEINVRNFIESGFLVFIPSYEGKFSSWSPPSDCLINAPVEMKTMDSVLPRYRAAFSGANIDFSISRKFFESVLGIPKCSWEHIVDELKHLQVTCDCQTVLSMYKELNKMNLSEASAKNLQHEFEQGPHGLIFANQMWYKPSQCLWSSTSTPIQGKINLAATFDSEFEKLFIEVLGVRRLDASLIYNELLGLKPGEVTVEHVKNLIWNLNSFLDIKPPSFSTVPPLPIRFDGKTALRVADSEFAILDRKAQHLLFYDKIPLLDFNLQEVCQLKSFLEWAGLKDRYLSRLVKEASTLDSSDKLPISEASRDIRRKAVGLCRIATHFKSPRVQQSGEGFYKLLYRARTWETPRIQLTLSVTVGSTSVTETVDRGDIYIESTSEQLDIYVPSDEELREESYISTLPKRLAHWMMTDPETNTSRNVDSVMVSLVQGAFYCSNSYVNRYLDGEGIIDVTIPELEDAHTDSPFTIRVPNPAIIRPVTPQRDVHQNLFSFVPTPTPETTRLFTPQRGISPISGYLSSENSAQDTPATYLTSPGSPWPHLGGNRPIFSPEDSFPSPLIIRATATTERRTRATEEYRELLSQVVSAARKSRLLSTAFDLSDLSNALESETTPSSKTFNEYDLFNAVPSKMERDMRVGAAGELFVFELLSSLRPSLSGFTRDNWRSTIRRYVTEHPDYANMDSWTGMETSDLEYDDEDGTLTETFITKGYLQSEWRTRRPKFYIEVKATPGTWDSPFFMSHVQYRKMRTLSTDNSIYVIFRVFNLYTGGIGCNVYIDPAKLEREGRLIFAADKWTVRPQYAQL